MFAFRDDYRLENGVFVLGYDVNHPTAMSKQDMARLRQQGVDAVAFDPSVVGVSPLLIIEQRSSTLAGVLPLVFA